MHDVAMEIFKRFIFVLAFLAVTIASFRRGECVTATLPPGPAMFRPLRIGVAPSGQVSAPPASDLSKPEPLQPS